MILAALLIPTLALIGQVHAIPIIPTPAHNVSETSHPAACDINHCRTLSAIIYSCLVTIFACTWLSFHPDIPNSTYTQWRIRAHHLFSVVLSFLVPELTVTKAATQCWRVWKLTPEFQRKFQGWTRTHMHFAIMGGFLDDRESGKALDASDLTAESHPELFKLNASPRGSPKEHGAQPWVLVTESEILDKSKGDGLGKLVAVLQTTWFIVQYLERWVSHQPRTQVEVMTLAYAAINIIIYILWWDKPLNVQEPIDVHGRAIPINARKKTLQGAWFNVMGEAIASLTAGNNITSGITVLPVVGVLFGGVHCFAWQFPFPTKYEATLWKVCAIYCTVYPVVVAVFFLLLIVAERLLNRRIPNWAVFKWLNLTVSFSFLLSLAGYVVCRIILLVLTFTCLRSPIPGIYEATNWTRFLPHVG